jgi:NADPH:quinone reductase-like Zn-dependent oxidoreductase
MVALFDEGGIWPAVDGVFAMNDAVKAAERMASSNQFGKIVLDID